MDANYPRCNTAVSDGVMCRVGEITEIDHKLIVYNLIFTPNRDKSMPDILNVRTHKHGHQHYPKKAQGFQKYYNVYFALRD